MNVKINFYNENVSYCIRNKGALKRWIINAISKEGKTASEVSFILCDDAFLYELNYKYLRHKTLTDILTFSYSDDSSCISGDIFISFPRIKENARTFKQKIETELNRVIIHGILHLVGYNDLSKNEKTLMTAKEDFYLALLHTNKYIPKLA